LAKKKKLSADAELQRLEEIKKLVVIAMFSDDLLMERLVLKGGNALDLIHRISTRASIDVDFSMQGDFRDEGERESALARVRKALIQTFGEAGYHVFDVRMEDRPEGLIYYVRSLGHRWFSFRKRLSSSSDRSDGHLLIQTKEPLQSGLYRDESRRG